MKMPQGSHVAWDIVFFDARIVYMERRRVPRCSTRRFAPLIFADGSIHLKE